MSHSSQLKSSISLAVLSLLLSTCTLADQRAVVLEEESEQAHFKLTLVADGMDFGWDMEFLPDGRLLISEYDGRLRIVDTGSGQQHVIDAIKDVSDRGGLRGIAAHPQFESNRMLYLCYATGSFESNHTRIARAVFDGNSIARQEIIFDAVNEANQLAHYGCRLLWLKDGTLIATFGDRRHHANKAQSLGDNYGTAIRINDDGSIPGDNPYSATAGVRQEIWAFGLRNTQGAVFHPETGEIWACDHGPYGGDEINVIKPGRNYGWPIATFGIDYDGTSLTDTPLRPETQAPRYYWYPSIAPSSVAFYTGTEFPKWNGDLFVTALAKQRLIRLELHDGHIIRTEELLAELDVRLRDVTMGPDGKLYLLTDSGDGRLFRFDPQ